MRVIYRIARLELSNLFCSPVAWLLLIFFIYMTGSEFGGMLEQMSKSQELAGRKLNAISFALFTSGIWKSVINLFYMIMPLLTMGLMSQEFNRGSVKLLFAAPITAKHIVLGKYVGIMLYGLLMVGILLVYIIIAGCVVVAFDWPAILAGLLGLYLLYAVYAAIGLFMSSLTTYQIVAAIGMLALLTFLNVVSGLWQEYEFVRDVTYWLAISGRVQTFIKGMICSEDVLYFLIIAAMFVWFTVLRIRLYREQSSFSNKLIRYLSVFVVAMLLGYVSSRPMMKVYYDGTYTKDNTLTPVSQDIMSRLDGGLKITTYVNLFGGGGYYVIRTQDVNKDMSRYENYIRFKPETKFDYVFYYQIDTTTEQFKKRYPDKTLKEAAQEIAKLQNCRFSKYLTPQEINDLIDLSGENYRFVSLIERENGQKTFLRAFNDGMRVPSEQEISAALKRLAMKLPRVGFVSDHETRSITGTKNRDYTGSMASKSNRHALINQGFDIVDIRLCEGGQELDSIDVLVVSEPLEDFSAEELDMLNRYVDRGGNMILAGKPKTSSYIEPLLKRLGLRFEPGVLVQKPIPEYTENILLCRIPECAKGICEHWSSLFEMTNFEKLPFPLVMTDAAAIEQIEDKGFKVTPLVVSRDSACWNELETIDFVNEEAKWNPRMGESIGEKVTVMALERERAGKQQRIMVIGDANCFSMGELSTSRRGILMPANGRMIMAMFNWLSYEELPLDVSRPPHIDTTLNLGMDAGASLRMVLQWILPVFVLLVGVIVLFRRKRK